jgi:hypothetical protein
VIAVVIVCFLISLTKKQPTKQRSFPFTDEQIRTYYDENPGLFTLPDQIRIKMIISPSLEAVKNARARVIGGEEIDPLIAEHFVSYYASLLHNPASPNKDLVSSGWKPREYLSRWKAERLAVGEYSEPFQLPGRKEYVVIVVVDQRNLGFLPFEEVADNAYSRLCDELQSTVKHPEQKEFKYDIVRDDTSNYARCLRLAKDLSEKGKNAEAVGAALQCLYFRQIEYRRERLDQYPEEQILGQAGVDLPRYYRGIINRGQLEMSQPSYAVHRLIAHEGANTARFLISQLKYEGPLTELCIRGLGGLNNPRAIPALKKFLTNDLIKVRVVGEATKETISIIYPLRMAALEALRSLGEKKQDIATSVGDNIVIPTRNPEGQARQISP